MGHVENYVENPVENRVPTCGETNLTKDCEKTVAINTKTPPRWSLANRGKNFEKILEYANRYYKNSGTAIIAKQYVEMLPIRNGKGQIVTCKIGEKSTVDYLGRYGGYPIAIEAKESNQGSIRFDAVQDHQARFLEAYSQPGIAIGLVLVSFDTERFFAVPAVFWLPARKAWAEAQRKGKRTAEKITIAEYGQTWTTPGKASVRPEELLPEWEVFPTPNCTLHYLKGAERYIGTPK